MTESLLPLVVVAPLAGGGMALLGKLARNGAVGRFASMLAVASIAGCAVPLVLLAPGAFAGETVRYALGGWPEPYGIAMVMDGFAWLSACLTAVVSLLIGVAALSRRAYGPAFFFFLLLLVAGMLSVALTGDLFTMFVSFEIVALAAYVLIAWDRTSAGLVAGLKYLLLSSVGILFFLFGIFLIYRDVGMLSIASVGNVLRAPAAGDTPSMHLAIAALCVGIGVRTAFLPFHTWLPEAHAYAPHPISALLSGVLIKISFFAMIRILRAFSAAYLNELLLWIGGATAFAAVIMALSQSDAKRLLAYHSVSQMGYVLAAFAAAGSVSLAASVSHAVNHALFKSLLFLTVGTAVELTGERDLFRMQPLGRRAPVLALFYLVGALSIAGLPPFNGYVSKALVLQSVAGSPVSALLWATAAATIASFIKLSRIFAPARQAEPVGAGDARPGDGTDVLPGRPTRPGALVLVSTTALAALCVLTGVYGGPLAQALHGLTGSPGAFIAPRLYTAQKLLSTAAATVAGAGLYALVVSRPGHRVTAVVKRYAPDLRSVLLLFLLGLLGFGAVAYL